MIINQLALLRAFSRMSQAGFAKAMGVPLRTYENLESGRTPVREVHLQAARMAIVQLAVVFPDEGYIPVPLHVFVEQTLVAHAKAAESSDD
jgi:transcriptional regulator with XRE-family HTH domain